LSALEAMAARMPVISSNAGGLPEVNINGITGYLADVGDIDRMSQCAIELLGNEELLNTFKQQAFEHACKFDIHNIVPQYEELYSRFCTMECSKEREGY
jgi:glycosyltransferase involved in cell wall biosynthesis